MADYKRKYVHPETAIAYCEIWETTANVVIIMFDTKTGDVANVATHSRFEHDAMDAAIGHTCKRLIENHSPIARASKALVDATR